MSTVDTQQAVDDNNLTSPPHAPNKRLGILRTGKEASFAESRDSITSHDFDFEEADSKKQESSNKKGSEKDFHLLGMGGGALVVDSPLAGGKPSVGPILIKPLGGGPGQNFKFSLARQNSGVGGGAAGKAIGTYNTATNNSNVTYNSELQR